MRLHYPKRLNNNGTSPLYTCQNSEKIKQSESYHRTNIHITQLDREVVKKIVEILTHPLWLRERIAELKEKDEPVVSDEDIAATIENIRRSMQNIYTLAEKATDDETIAHLTQRMNALELQKRQAEALLFTIEDENEKQEKLEEEIVKFELWVEQVRPLLTNNEYVPSREELRLALRILGIQVTVFPLAGEYPYRYRIDATIPEIMKKLDIVSTPVHY